MPGFKRKADASFRTAIDLLQHLPPCLQGRLLRRKRRQAGGDQIRIDEGRDPHLQGKSLPGEGDFAGTIGPCDADPTGGSSHNV